MNIKVLPVKSGSPDIISYKVVDTKDKYIAKGYYEQLVKPDEGRYHRLELHPWHRTRTLGQNSLWHKMLQVVAAAAHVDMELIKQGLKEVAMEQYGYPGELNPITKKQSPKPSHLATVKEMSILFEVTFIECGEAGIDLSEFVEDYRKSTENARRRETAKAE